MPDRPAGTATGATESAASWTRRRLGNTPVFFVVGVLAAAVFTIGWGYALMSYGGSGSGVSVQVVAWKVESADEASVSFQVNSDAPAECVITARDAQHVVVGQKSVDVESGIRDVTATVETIREASAVEVGSCREQSSTR
ncbi:DUF4307 domain-containing protein [Streptomonospora wellingtoniae]|uniref:DUF4307 domain-containing protein n=1 Tax=Streptomonospora wellingtoniae TaxID=3075544 RepID=A0ABU2KZV1_9ACTN|nr:DUF4307 domain-containing protein [Streptomonospora sp. DSM 45055]MDT0304538.1 DUF4307 domain-containing protein [Streptomonospora sp. DSM 45055]